MDEQEAPCSPLASWLSPQEQSLWHSLISVVLSLPVVLDRELQGNDGLSHFEFAVLVRLSQAPDSRLRLNELARQTGSTLPRLSKAITRCQREGWVIRRADPTDGRATLAVLTDAGRERLTASTPAHIAQVRRLVLDPLTPAARRNLDGALAAIHRAVQQDLYQGRAVPRT